MAFQYSSGTGFAPYSGALGGMSTSTSNMSNHATVGYKVGDDTIAGGIPSPTDVEGSAFDAEPEPGLSDFMSENPGLSPEEYMSWMAQHSDEWAEKYLDYLTEKGQLESANEYTAQREDTAYQRLVADLRAAGLNPAMMYGSSASPSAAGSQGYIKMTEGANSRAVGNYSKLKNLFLQFMLYQLKEGKLVTDSIFKGFDAITSIFKLFS